MIEEKKHIISKIFVDVNVNSVENATKIKNNIEVFLKHNFLSSIENYLNTIHIDKNKILQIDNLILNIDLKSIYLLEKIDLFTESFKNEINKHVKDQLTPITETENSRLMSVQDKISEAFFSFLKTGERPWYIDEDSFNKIFDAQVLKEIRKSDKFRIEFDKILNHHDAFKRLILQFSNENLILFFGKELATQSSQFIKDFNRIFSLKLQPHFWKIIAGFYKTKDKDELYFSVFKLIETSEINTENTCQDAINFTDKLLAISSGPNNIKEIVEKARNKKKEEELYDLSVPQLETEHISASNSKDVITNNIGLVLLHPYLKVFLKDCELLDANNIFVDKEKAVHLLHYVATFKENDSENNMLFEKFLCNIPLHHPIKKDIKLSKKLKLKTQDLLSSTIKNWPALKNTSIETLQNEFLQRRGKLILSEDNPKIIIERKTQDILMEKLPWNISIVKIPWIDKIVFVEW